MRRRLRDYEGVGVRKDGTRFPTHVAVSQVDLPDGWAALSFISDTTDRKRAAEAYQLFRALVDHADDSIEIIDPETGRFLDVSEKAVQVHGYTREEHLALTIFDVDPNLAEAGFAGWQANLAKIKQAGALIFESLHKRKDGTIFPVEVNATYVELERDYLLAVVRDISERMKAEHHIRRLNRLYAVLSEINELIVREKDPEELLETACHIAVETGKFRVAWIGLLDPKTQVLRSAASAVADGGDLGAVDIDTKAASSSDWLCVQAMRAGAHQFFNDIAGAGIAGRERAAALERGYRAAAAFPLKVGDKAVGAFTLYAAEAGFFDADELHLLDELAATSASASRCTNRKSSAARPSNRCGQASASSPARLSTPPSARRSSASTAAGCASIARCARCSVTPRMNSARGHSWTSPIPTTSRPISATCISCSLA